MALSPSLIVPAQLLEIAYQSAALIHMGRGRELSGALRDQRTDPPPLESLAQAETLRAALRRDPSLLDALNDALSYLQKRADYRVSSQPFPERREVIAGHEMIGIPGGLFAMGNFHPGPPRWVRLDPFLIGRTAVTNGQYSAMAHHDPDLDFHAPETAWGRPEGHPVVNVSWEDSAEFAEDLSRTTRRSFRLPTDAERECAARGSAVPLKELMEEELGRFRPKDFPEFVGDQNWGEGRFQNFFTELGGRLFIDDREEELRKILRTAAPLYGYRVYATPSGRFDDVGEPYADKRRPEERGYRKVLRSWPILRSLVEIEEPYRPARLPPADWGPDNAFGLKQMMAGINEYTYERMVRGACIVHEDLRKLTAVTGCEYPARMQNRNERTGFRLALSV